MVRLADRVPAVRVLHIQQVKHPHFVTLIGQVAGHAFIKFIFGIGQDDALAPLHALEYERPDEPPALAGTRRAHDQQAAGEAGLFAGRDIVRISVTVQRVVLMLTVDRAGKAVQPAHIQYPPHLLPLHEPARAVCAVRQDIEPAPVLYRMIAGYPVIPLARQQAGHRDQ